MDTRPQQPLIEKGLASGYISTDHPLDLQITTLRRSRSRSHTSLSNATPTRKERICDAGGSEWWPRETIAIRLH
ncbi:hypothetical protein VN97_g10212 [Penicillium thymicola]|uniref:Uncharacterized protein n=1 Tax=Penicillium thymicola TaxID=293382 RepID=A0AAI9T9E0_PENTH|nr:hypothetical protein VN97_g10212 [Penicillium thymicola]